LWEGCGVLFKYFRQYISLIVDSKEPSKSSTDVTLSSRTDQAWPIRADKKCNGDFSPDVRNASVSTQFEGDALMVEENRSAIAARYPLPGPPVISLAKLARVFGGVGEARKSRVVLLRVAGIVAVIALALGACSARLALTEDEQYARADALILAWESFESMRRACLVSGGTISITRTVTRIGTRPHRSEYRLARCVRL